MPAPTLNACGPHNGGNAHLPSQLRRLAHRHRDRQRFAVHNVQNTIVASIMSFAHAAPGLSIKATLGFMQNTSKPRILLIDDNAGFRELVRIMLSYEGYSVAVAEDAVEGGKAILTGQHDLVILDIDMPFLNGFELLSAMRADPNTAGMKVIIVSGSKHVEALTQAENLGVLDYLVKPVARERLLESIDACLKRGGGK
jgi:CheY-like chemotaxis protein